MLKKYSKIIKRKDKIFYNFIVDDVVYKYNLNKKMYDICVEANCEIINNIKNIIAQNTVDVQKELKNINLNVSFVIPKQKNRVVLLEMCTYCEHLEQYELYFITKNVINLTREKKIKNIFSELKF